MELYCNHVQIRNFVLIQMPSSETQSEIFLYVFNGVIEDCDSITGWLFF